MARLWSRYMHYLDVYPLPTKILTSGTLYTAGDGIAQYVDGTIAKRGYNVDRGVKAAIWGGVIFAPLAHVWYNRVLERYVPGTSGRAVLTKVFLDQTAWAIVINTFYLSYAYDIASPFLTPALTSSPSTPSSHLLPFPPSCVCSTMFINGGSAADAQRAVETKMWPLMKANWLLWPAVQVVNFRFVPAPLQVPFINVIVLGWSAFLALLATGGEEEQKEGKELDKRLSGKIEEIK